MDDGLSSAPRGGSDVAARVVHAGASASPRARRLARVVTKVCAPAVCGGVGLVAVAVHNTGSGAGAAWGGLAAIFVCGLPMAFAVTGVRDGRWDDHHVADRDKRALPLLVALASVVAGAVLLAVVNAPRELVALVLTTVPELIIAITVSHSALRRHRGNHPRR